MAKKNYFQWDIEIHVLDSLHRLYLILAHHLMLLPESLEDLKIHFTLDEVTADHIHIEVEDFISLRNVSADLTVMTVGEDPITFRYPMDREEGLEAKAEGIDQQQFEREHERSERKNYFQWRVKIKKLEELNLLHLILAYNLIEFPESLDDLRIGLTVNEETALVIHEEVKKFILDKELRATLQVVTVGETPTTFQFPLEH